MKENLAALFFDQVTKKRDKTALMRKEGGRFVGISWSDYGRAVRRAAGALKRMGVQRGDRVAIFSYNSAEWATMDLAALSCGAIVVPIYFKSSPSQVAYILKDSGAKVIYVGDAAQLGAVLPQAKGLPVLSAVIAPDGIVDGQKAGKVRVVPFSETQTEEDERVFEKDLAPHLNDIEAGDVATIVYTSGTTGEPKGVMLTHKNLIANVRADMAVVELTDADLGLSFLPTSHVLDRVVVHYMSVIAGGTIAYAQSLETVLADVAGTHPTAMCGVPRMFEKIYNAITDRAEAGPPTARRLFFWAEDVGREFVLMRKEKKRPGLVLRLKYLIADLLVFSKVRKFFGGRMRLFASGGAHLREDIDLFFRAVKIPIMHGYGLTEATCTVTLNTKEDFMPETLGRPLPGVEVKIAPDGEILLRGDIVMKGYFNRPEETREALREGWLHTGDVGHLTGDGYLVMTDRKKDILSTSGGKNISRRRSRRCCCCRGLSSRRSSSRTGGGSYRRSSSRISPSCRSSAQDAA